MTTIPEHMGPLWPGPTTIRLEVAALSPSRWRGSLLGGACGDALGRPAEARSPERVREKYGILTDFHPWRGWRSGPIGTWTDDTQMTMCVAQSLVASRSALQPEDLAQRFVEWLPVGRGKGRTCVAAVEALIDGDPWWEAGQPSAGNGAAMRSAPIGLRWPHDVEQLRRDAAVSAAITHADGMAVASAIVLAYAVARCATAPAGSLEPHGFIDELVACLDGAPDPALPVRGGAHKGEPVSLGERIGELKALLGRPAAEAFSYLHQGAYVLESLPAALWCFLEHLADPERAIIEAANGGFDADTVASMVGNLAGAYHGEEALPQRWLAELEGIDDLRALADGLLELARHDLEGGVAD